MKKIGLIPAAGRGSRLDLPFSKELYPIPYQNTYIPVILSNILALKKIGVLEVIVVISPYKSDIMDYLGNGSKWDLNIYYVVQEQPKSLPDALSKAFNLITDKVVYFLMGDTIILSDDFLVTFESMVNDSYDISLGCFYTDNPSKFATLTMVNDVVNFCEEKNPNSKNRIMWGFWRWKPSFTLKLINSASVFNSKNREQTMSEIIEKEIELGFVQGVLLSKYKYYDLGTFEEINNFIKTLVELKDQIKLD